MAHAVARTMAISTVMSMALYATAAQAADPITLQLKWVPQAQFAGYYVAQAKGYYKAEGVDVVNKLGGPHISTMVYNAYWPVIDAGVKEIDLVTFFYEDQGAAAFTHQIWRAAQN